MCSRRSGSRPRRTLSARSLDPHAIQGLLTVAPTIHRFLPPMILLAWRTGRRLSSIISLRWDDVDFERGTILWRLSMTKSARLGSCRCVGRFCTSYFASATRIEGSVARCFSPPAAPPTSPRTSDATPRRLLAEGSLLSRSDSKTSRRAVAHVPTRLGDRAKGNLPLKDVAAAGGWRDTSTLLRYQQPDEETLRAVVEFQRPRSSAIRLSRKPLNLLHPSRESFEASSPQASPKSWCGEHRQ